MRRFRLSAGRNASFSAAAALARLIRGERMRPEVMRAALVPAAGVALGEPPPVLTLIGRAVLWRGIAGLRD